MELNTYIVNIRKCILYEVEVEAISPEAAEDEALFIIEDCNPYDAVLEIEDVRLSK